jgi:hypothetical protein
MNLAHRFARLRIRRCRDGASIQHYYVGQAVLAYKRQAAREHLAAKRGGIRFCGATAKILNRKSSHVAWSVSEAQAQEL